MAVVAVVVGGTHTHAQHWSGVVVVVVVCIMVVAAGGVHGRQGPNQGPNGEVGCGGGTVALQLG